MKEIISFIVDMLMVVVFFILKILSFLSKYVLLPILKFFMFIGSTISEVIKQFCSYSLSTYGIYGYILVIPLIVIIVYAVITIISKIKDIITGGWNYGDVKNIKYKDNGNDAIPGMGVYSYGKLECDEPEYQQRQEQRRQEQLNKTNTLSETPKKRKSTPVEKPKCVFCNGPATVGPGCGFSPYKDKIHARAPDGIHCVYCGGNAIGPGCGFSPTKNHSRVLIYK